MTAPSHRVGTSQLASAAHFGCRLRERVKPCSLVIPAPFGEASRVAVRQCVLTHDYRGVVAMPTLQRRLRSDWPRRTVEAVALSDMDDRQDFADADRGFIAPLPGPGRQRRRARDLRPRRLRLPVADDAPRPDTVNPSLWRQSQVIARGGLYKVVDGLYQVRNNDIGEPHHRRGRRRPGHHRLHEPASSGRAGHGPVPRARQRQAGRRGDLHPHPRRPLRRRQRRRRRRATSPPGRCRSSRRARSPRSTSSRSARTSSPATRCPGGPVRLRQPARPRAAAGRHLRHRDRHTAGTDDLLHLPDRPDHRDRDQARPSPG